MRNAIAATMIAGVMSLSACGFEWPDPCADAPAASQEQINQVNQGFEVDWGDCELDSDGNWYWDD